MKSIIKDLAERIAKLGNSSVDLNRPVIYRYQHHFKYGIWEDNCPWHYFAEMQLSSLELEELQQIDFRRKQLGYASIVQPSRPEDQAEDHALCERREKLLETAELRAEKLEGKPWRDWLAYFILHVLPEMQKPHEVNPRDEDNDLWNWKIKVFDDYRQHIEALEEAKQI